MLSSCKDQPYISRRYHAELVLFTTCGHLYWRGAVPNACIQHSTHYDGHARQDANQLDFALDLSMAVFTLGNCALGAEQTR